MEVSPYDVNQRLTVGSSDDKPTDPFSNVNLTPYCSDSSPINVTATSHACSFSALGRAEVRLNNLPFPLSEYSWSIETTTSGPSWECRVSVSGSTSSPGIMVESDRPQYNRCAGSGEVTWRHNPTGAIKSYTVEIVY